MTQTIFYPPEWYPQDCVEMAWPDVHTDWNSILPEVRECYLNIASEIMKHAQLILLCVDEQEVKPFFSTAQTENLVLVELKYNDTWARDFGGITVFKNGEPVIYDFTFNGWGLKFAANYDNYTNRILQQKGLFGSSKLLNRKNTVLEGGSIETDGAGTLMTTTSCLLSPHRNDESTKEEMELLLKESFGVNKVIWIQHGWLVGDDTDGHIDTLARFAPGNRIVYCKCYDREDEHFNDLKEMEKELQQCKNAQGEPFILCPVPLPSALFDENDRLPATYVNYLILNKNVLVPVYGVKEDSDAMVAISAAYPEYTITAINCLALVKQHGSLHCVTMNYPQGFCTK